MSEKYNGWTNYETWKVNLELVDSEYLGECLSDYDNFSDFIKLLKYSVQEIAFKGLEDNSIASSAVSSMMSRVNWTEIAEHIQEAYAEEV